LKSLNILSDGMIFKPGITIEHDFSCYRINHTDKNDKGETDNAKIFFTKRHRFHIEFILVTSTDRLQSIANIMLTRYAA